MNILLGDNYKLKSDSMNYILQRKNIVQDGENKGKESWVNVGYFGRIEQLVNLLVDLEIKRSNVEELGDLIKVVREVENNIVKNIKLVAEVDADEAS